MSTSRFGRWIGSLATLLGLLLLASAARGQRVFVNRETGENGNLRETPSAAVQTITRALEIAASNPTISWTVFLAGRVDDEREPIPYEEGESFPIPLLLGVALVWDRDDSESLPGREEAARPLIRTREAGRAFLALPPPHMRFADGTRTKPSGSKRRARLSGIDLEGGSPAISISDPPDMTLSVVLEDLMVRGSQGCLRGRSLARPVRVMMRPCSFEGTASNSPELPILVGFGAAGAGSIRATIEDCAFGSRCGPLLVFQAVDGARLRPQVSNCTFVSSTSEDPRCTQRLLNSDFRIVIPREETR